MVEEFYTLTEKDRRAMIQANMESLVLRASGEKGEGWVLSFEMGVTKVSTDDDEILFRRNAPIVASTIRRDEAR